MDKKQYKENKKSLESAGIEVTGDHKHGCELDCYTLAGENMVFTLDELTSEKLNEYLDNFDINERVVMWWPNGHKLAENAVPFTNLKEHYEDYEKWIQRMRELADRMPY